jgi:DNA-binding CsgD family transcriptional regulator
VSVPTVERTKDVVVSTAGRGLDWVDYSAAVSDAVQQMVPFQRCCWHTVDPGTVLFTGSVNRGIHCSGSWLAHHEYIVEDVNKWAFLAHSGRFVGATSLDTHGDLSRSARHRQHESMGLGDELRISLVADGVYWGAVSFLRNDDEPWFTERDVAALRRLVAPLATGLRRALLAPAPGSAPITVGPGVIVFDGDGLPESISPSAETWIGQMVEDPPPPTPIESRIVQAIAARARTIDLGTDPIEVSARSRVRTRSGAWLLLYGTRLNGAADGRTAVIIQPATPHEVAPIVALAYGLTERESAVTMECIRGRSTKEIAKALTVSPYTVQDHLKSIFDKTGVRSRGELVGQVFLEHYAPRWEVVPDAPDGWWAKGFERH